MASLTNIEIGSIVYNLIAGIPVGISGTLSYLAELAVYTAENRTGNDISISSIEEMYQPAIINLTISQILGQMEAQGIGTKSVSIDTLSVSKGLVEGTSQNYKNLAYNQLNDLGHKMSYYQTYT